jgi:hypothetical protein
MFAGAIPGLTKDDAHQWAHETKSIKKLPDRAPAEKGKPTLRSKKATEERGDKGAGPRDLRHLAAIVAGAGLGLGVAKALGGDLPSKITGTGLGTFAGGQVAQKLWPRSKKANGDMMQYFADHPEKHENYLDRKEADRIRRGKSKVAQVFRGLEDIVAEAFKFATLGSAVVNPNNVGKLRGMMTTNAMKAPGYAASTQAMSPVRGVVSAMNKAKPH